MSQNETTRLKELLRLREETIAAQAKEIAELKPVIESDRSTIADGVTKLKKELDSRHWLTEGRGPHEWNDDEYQQEFLAAGQALLVALKPLEKIAADLTHSPQTTEQVIEARRNLKQERDDTIQELTDELELWKALNTLLGVPKGSDTFEFVKAAILRADHFEKALNHVGLACVERDLSEAYHWFYSALVDYGDNDFDAIGLKPHFFRWCAVFNSIESLEEEERRRREQKSLTAPESTTYVKALREQTAKTQEESQ